MYGVKQLLLEHHFFLRVFGSGDIFINEMASLVYLRMKNMKNEMFYIILVENKIIDIKPELLVFLFNNVIEDDCCFGLMVFLYLI